MDSAQAPSKYYIKSRAAAACANLPYRSGGYLVTERRSMPRSGIF